MKVTVRTEGLRDVQRALKQLPRATERAVMRRMLKRAAEPLVETAQMLAPVREGDLVESIHSSPRASGVGGSDRAAYAEAMRATGGDVGAASAAMRSARRSAKSDVVTLFVGPGRHPQAITQEFGTSFHPAQPFMRPAWDRDKAVVLAIIETEFMAEVLKTVERSRARAARRAGG